MTPRQLARLELAAQQRREQPGANDVLALRAQVEGEHQIVEFRVALPAARELRGERRGRPGIHDVDLALEAAGHAALLLGEASWHITRGVNGKLRGIGKQGLVEDRVAICIERVPDRDRHAEEALARDEPVAREPLDPVLVAHAHEVGVPLELFAVREQPLAQLLVAGAVLDVPLAGRHDLERLVALLEELDGVVDLANFALQLA